MKLPKPPSQKHLAILVASLAAVTAVFAFMAADIMFGFLFTAQAVIMSLEAWLEGLRDGQRVEKL